MTPNKLLPMLTALAAFAIVAAVAFNGYGLNRLLTPTPTLVTVGQQCHRHIAQHHDSHGAVPRRYFAPK